METTLAPKIYATINNLLWKMALHAKVIDLMRRSNVDELVLCYLSVKQRKLSRKRI